MHEIEYQNFDVIFLKEFVWLKFLQENLICNGVKNIIFYFDRYDLERSHSSYNKLRTNNESTLALSIPSCLFLVVRIVIWIVSSQFWWEINRFDFCCILKKNKLKSKLWAQSIYPINSLGSFPCIVLIHTYLFSFRI